MAAFTILAKAAVMDVNAPMAVDTLARQLGRVPRAGMARGTDQPLVPPGQRELRCRIVVEGPRLPVARVVAGAAL